MHLVAILREKLSLASQIINEEVVLGSIFLGWDGEVDLDLFLTIELK